MVSQHFAKVSNGNVVRVQVSVAPPHGDVSSTVERYTVDVEIRVQIPTITLLGCSASWLGDLTFNETTRVRLPYIPLPSAVRAARH